jgi:hypothetical protein
VLIQLTTVLWSVVGLGALFRGGKPLAEAWSEAERAVVAGETPLAGVEPAPGEVPGGDTSASRRAAPIR